MQKCVNCFKIIKVKCIGCNTCSNLFCVDCAKTTLFSCDEDISDISCLDGIGHDVCRDCVNYCQFCKDSCCPSHTRVHSSSSSSSSDNDSSPRVLDVVHCEKCDAQCKHCCKYSSKCPKNSSPNL